MTSPAPETVAADSIARAPARRPAERPPLVLTIDVEWYYNGDAAGSVADFAGRSLEQRRDYDRGQIPRSVDRMLATLARHGQRITFFTVAEVDAAYPGLLGRIQAAGHEIGLHTFRHDDLATPEAFERDLAACGEFQRRYGVVSYRAPRISGRDFIYPLLRRHGYRYDSSVYGTGSFGAAGVRILPVAVWPARGSTLQRIPAPLGAALGQGALPFGSGIAAGLRFPAYRALIERYRRRYGPPCLFLHSWQVGRPHYPWRFLLRQPAMLPYALEAGRLFERLCARYRLMSVKEYFGD